MLKFFQEGWYYIYMTFFQTISLEREIESKNLSKFQNAIVFLKTYCVLSLIVLLLFVMVGMSTDVVGHEFFWERGFKRLVFGLVGGLVFGLVFGLVGGLSGGLVFGLVFGLGGGLVGVLVVGLVFGLVVGLSGDLVFGLVLGLAFGLIFGQGGGLKDYEWYSTELLSYLIVYFSAFSLIYFLTYYRLVYIIPHFIQYRRSLNHRNPFISFKHSPIYWDQMIRIPLPFLKEWLVNLVKFDSEKGKQEIEFILNKRPFQRKAAFEALLEVQSDELKPLDSVKKLSEIKQIFYIFPEDDKDFPKGLPNTLNELKTISELSQDYSMRQTTTGQLQILDALNTKLSEFQRKMKLTAAPVGTTFEPISAQWLNMVKAEQTLITQQQKFTDLPNPYIAGNTLNERDQNLFVGRQDILLAIEKFILNTEKPPALLLYGRRRTGKSSTLLNLPSSRFKTVYIDCQDAKWHESDQAFCYNLAHDIYKKLYASTYTKDLKQPTLENFEKNAFTQLDQFLTQAQNNMAQDGKRILLAFDEYEGLENSIIKGDLSDKVLGKLRNLIQHAPSIVVLVSGSHRLEELTRLNWANYLINTQTLELSYLTPEPARDLLTHPVPDLQYEAGVVDEIIRVTHCQPYLLQAVASELVNHLNHLQQKSASLEQAEYAFEQVLTRATSYFSDTWRNENTEDEKTLMRALALGQWDEVFNPSLEPTLKSLIRKELVIKTAASYQLAVELFARWIRKNGV